MIVRFARRLAPRRVASRIQATNLHTSSTKRAPTPPAPAFFRQRRYSSSKPSNSSSSDSRSLPASAAPSGKDAAPTARKRAASKGGKAKAAKEPTLKAAAANAGSNLPMVPPTQHLHSQDVNLATFFSLHRPISIMAPVPTASTMKAFSSIFTPSQTANGKPGGRSAETMLTLSSAVKVLDKAINAHEQNHHPQQQPGGPQANEIRLGDADGQGVVLNLEELARNFRPFNPPPPPEPMPAAAEETKADAPAAAAAAEEEEATLQQLQQQKRWAPGGPDARLQISVPFYERLRGRRVRWLERTEDFRRGVWQAISVKRQRRLKMKKHKFKKLMKRTRNLRRRQDRL